ncbi:TetR/AcrR family transcriptional regulator [Amycolatopsis australiensis]|uniref:DNA-binding transcriptional regulator, AcrR family n=1 Tax=Amycolatopsis australiensis TaxID=546364 RepID=A0A1K1SMV0_9PSEU|nr:TetR/AcrR family transcriptional regulator [Amycolatopsis australiensis]SFW85622.1 DNA-binding transcriptional regulator, AcrR family [Amycolatopsis australiensis]
MVPEVTSSSAPPGDGRAARWAGQRERRRREFVDAALRAIAEHGPDVSTGRIADVAGVARPQLYKHFDDATDLKLAIADRATELITTALLPIWEPQGSAMQMIAVAVDAHTGWLAENGNLYRYLTRHSQLEGHLGRDAVADVKTVIARQLTQVFEFYLTAFQLDTRIADVVSFGVVGLVDSCAAQWLEEPRGITRTQLTDLLTRWIWRIVDDALRAGGIELDPHLPLPPPPRRQPPSPPG